MFGYFGFVSGFEIRISDFPLPPCRHITPMNNTPPLPLPPVLNVMREKRFLAQLSPKQSI